MESFIILGVIGVWLIGLTIAFFFQFKFLDRLTYGAKKKEIKKILSDILDAQKKGGKKLLAIEKELSRLEEEGLGHVQKVGLVRFNPFREIGGDHSFSLAILDGKENGVVITGLHTRERTRVYAKAIKKGKCKLELSAEEKKALEEAQKS
jgi:hypothetical protein